MAFLINSTQYLGVKIQMDPLCQRCYQKPAVTICLKGKLCFLCGTKCHGQYQHPVQFIRHCSETARPDKKTMKSSTIITTSKSLKQLPRRVSKVSSKLCLTRVKIEQTEPRPKKNTTQASVFKQSNKQNSILQLNCKSQLKESKKSIGIMAQESIKVNHQEKQVEMLKRKVAKQDEVIKALCEKLKRQKNEKQNMRKNYEQKLKFIRNLRD